MEMTPVAAGAFPMGRPYEFDGLGQERETPVHEVYLDAYEISTYPITNRQFADVLNWALNQGYLADPEGKVYTGGPVYAYSAALADIAPGGVIFEDGRFMTRHAQGHDGAAVCLADHPVVRVSWHGAVVFCNWLSQMHGLPPAYDTAAWERHEPVTTGYRLPTEAEWERTAAWDGQKHWRYGVTSDNLDYTRANFKLSDDPPEQSNPLCLTWFLQTSPVGWYNGLNPARLAEPDILTKDGASPVGCYDMAGSVLEWCHDWFDADYYAHSPGSNPAGPREGLARSVRGGTKVYPAEHCRAAYRVGFEPVYRSFALGFRIARTPDPVNHSQK